jgi:hypothetical protein
VFVSCDRRNELFSEERRMREDRRTEGQMAMVEVAGGTSRTAALPKGYIDLQLWHVAQTDPSPLP